MIYPRCFFVDRAMLFCRSMEWPVIISYNNTLIEGLLYAGHCPKHCTVSSQLIFVAVFEKGTTILAIILTC